MLPTLQFWRDGAKLWEHCGIVELDQDLAEGVLMPQFYGLGALCVVQDCLLAEGCPLQGVCGSVVLLRKDMEGEVEMRCCYVPMQQILFGP